ncbi:5-formyltetrahydrofolate cyclo-ligase [Mycoplasma tullyi]|uniref:5-formyltetrahydrofolate cyclo-ligase n=1 Tax=Mycoplasma tullyi TaxID=1612150 RepID=A0A7D7XWA8_9MOLU|nr:5-formyltetrahydrofolate cyclo-ligase [Mycoplasma tullyi]QMT98834.1 5-formyltetrahydrofolate cyclo-ligase [Mycoplasma tullyi]
MQSKQIVRKQLIELAKQFTNTKNKQIVDQQLTELVYQFIKNKDYQKIGLFSSLSYEFDTSELINLLLKDNYQIYLPRVDGNEMNFYQIKDLDFSHDIKYQIKQPLDDPQLLNNNLDLFLVPLVGYNSNHLRLGHGKGYYDRFFNNLKYSNCKISVAYDFMLNNQFETQDHDVKIDKIFCVSNY